MEKTRPHRTPTKAQALTKAQPLHWLSNLAKNLQNFEVRLHGQAMSQEEGMELFMRYLTETRENGRTLWWVGNGGSNALCSHLSQDAMNKLKLKSMTFSDTSLVTCMANDFGYENVYSRPLSTMAEPGDLLVAISSSGNSKNILNCVNLAAEKGMRVVGVSGFKSDNQLWNTNQGLSFFLPCDLYGIAEVGHEALLHSMIESLWQREQAAKTDPNSFYN